MKKASRLTIISIAIVAAITFFSGHFSLKPSPIKASPPECRTSGKCDINNSNRDCCSGYVCVDSGHGNSGNGYCEVAPTNTPVPTQRPTSTPQPTNTPFPTATPTRVVNPTSTPTATPTQENLCKHEHAECFINSSDKFCCSGYVCVSSGHSNSGNGHCEIAPTSTPTSEVTLTPTPTSTPTSEVTLTPTPTETPTFNPSPTPTSEPSNNSSSNNSGNLGAPVCNDTKPGIPSNLTVTKISATQVLLKWTHAADPHSFYLIGYGPSVGNYPWGSPNVGNDNSYTVNSLTTGAQYCFYVKAQNGCMPGDPSNVVCINVGSTVKILGAAVLGAATNYNPLVEGIKDSFGGEVLGASTVLARTAETTHSSVKLPSGNTPVVDSFISIPSLGINQQQIYTPQNIGDELTVGSHEVLSTTLNGAHLYYGHNATDVFGTLFQAKIGDKIYVTQNGQTVAYAVFQTDFVSQNDISAVKADAPGEIILMTCSFTYPDHRILVKATPIL